MSRRIIIVIVVLLGPLSSDAQALELVNLITEKLIKAIDLRVQEMQNKVITLQNVQRQAENNLSRQKLAEIGSIEENEKSLFRDYYASLKQVKPSVAINRQVTMIQERQLDITALYNRIVISVRHDGNLLDKEKKACITSCEAIVIESKKNIQKVNDVLTETKLTATDAERIRLTGLAAKQLELQYRRLSALFQSCQRLSAGRANGAKEVSQLKLLYGL